MQDKLLEALGSTAAATGLQAVTDASRVTLTRAAVKRLPSITIPGFMVAGCCGFGPEKSAAQLANWLPPGGNDDSMAALQVIVMQEWADKLKEEDDPAFAQTIKWP